MAKKEILKNDLLTLRLETAPVEDILDTIESTTHAAQNAIEHAFDTVESQAERVVQVTKNNPFLLAGVALAAAGLGAFVAWKFTEKRLSQQFDEELTEQLAAAKSFHKRLAKEGEFGSPESAVQALVPDEVIEAVQSYQGREKPVPYNKPDTIEDPRPPVETIDVEEVTVQTEHDPRDWDFNAEIADRELHPDLPYVISFEEFQENSESHEQATLTYYASDDTLADERETPIDDTDKVVGDDNLTRFGHGSKDHNVVYVRNEKLGMDFEIIQSRGSYQQEVLGTEPESSLQHSRRRPNRRAWRADE